MLYMISSLLALKQMTEKKMVFQSMKLNIQKCFEKKPQINLLLHVTVNVYSDPTFIQCFHFQDILSNDSFVLNREFSISLIRDIIQVRLVLDGSFIY